MNCDTCTLELKVIFINTPDKKVFVILQYTYDKYIVRYMYVLSLF